MKLSTLLRAGTRAALHWRCKPVDNVGKFLESIQVYDCGMTKVRIGNRNDGGYVAYRELCERSRTVYSVGIGTDVGFELDWAERFLDCHFELFDPTIERLPQEHERFTFHRRGLGAGY